MLLDYTHIFLKSVLHFQWLPWKQPVLPCDSHVTVGVALDTDHAFSVLDKGPTADCKQVQYIHIYMY